MTQRFTEPHIEEFVDSVGSSTSIGGTHGTDSYSYSVGYSPTDWEQPVPSKDFEKYFEPVFKEAAKKIIAMLAQNQSSLEDFLAAQSANYYPVTGGKISGAVTVGSNLNVQQDIYINGQIWKLYNNDYSPVGHVQVGMIMPYAGGTSAPPGGWLVCDGSSYSQTSYPYLYDVIGSTYNTHCGASAPASGYFRVPNYKGRVLVGRDSGDGDFDSLTDYGGAKTHTLTTGEIPGHDHDINVTTSTSSGAHDNLNDYVAAGTNGASTRTSNNSVQNTGGGGAHNNVQPYAVVNYVIKY